MSLAMNLSCPISLGQVSQGFDISVAPEEMQDHLSLIALVNGVVVAFKPFHSQQMRLGQFTFDEGTNELLVLALLKPGVNSRQSVVEFKDVATQSVDRFIMTPTHDNPDYIEVLVEGP